MGAVARQGSLLTRGYSLIAFTDKEPKDWMVPSRWGTVSGRVGCCVWRGADMSVCRLTSATTRTRPSRATGAAPSCRQRARCKWSCPFTAFLRGRSGYGRVIFFSHVLEKVDNTQRNPPTCCRIGLASTTTVGRVSHVHFTPCVN